MKRKTSPRQRRINEKNRRRTRKMLREVEAIVATAAGLGEYHVQASDFDRRIEIYMAVGPMRWGVAAGSRGRVMWCKRQWTAAQIVAQATILLNRAAEAHVR